MKKKKRKFNMLTHFPPHENLTIFGNETNSSKQALSQRHTEEKLYSINMKKVTVL